MKDFKEDYMRGENTIGTMAEAFQTELVKKYLGIKQELLSDKQ